MRALESDGRTRSITPLDPATATGALAGTIPAKDVLAKFGR